MVKHGWGNKLVELPNLRSVRLRRLLTQRELAKIAGLTTASVNRIENGTTKARISTVRRLAQALDVDPEDLLAVNELPPSSQHKGSDT